MSAEKNIGYAILAAMAAAFAWLTFGKGRAVTLGSGAAVTTGTLLTPDPVTGAAQYDSRIPGNSPGGIIGPPIASPIDPTNPKTFSCPIGYQLWKDVATGGYVCAQQGAPLLENSSPQYAALASAEGGTIIS